MSVADAVPCVACCHVCGSLGRDSAEYGFLVRGGGQEESPRCFVNFARSRASQVRALASARALAQFGLAALGAHASGRPSGDFALQRFDPAAGPHNYLSTRGARTDGQNGVERSGSMANYSFRPFEVRQLRRRSR